ncbi:MAG: DUF4915 domain-containing protein [Candidatus Woesearchaeota archaeon]
MQDNNLIFILGGLNANNEDRHLDKSNLKPAQILNNKQVQEISYFSGLGVRGIASIAFYQDKGVALFPSIKQSYFDKSNTSQESMIKQVNLQTSEEKIIPIEELKDIHEIELINDTLWIPNTGYDEAIAYDLNKEAISNRIRLKEIPSLYKTGSELGEDDKFHLNHIFEGFDGDLYCLVHHVDGKQKFYQDAELKKQGNGGVINLSKNFPVQLNLKSPHTVKKVNGNYWIFDSARFKIKIYNQNWKILDQIDTQGYGRGAAYDPYNKLFYAGISSIRKRYLKLFTKQNPNMIQVINTQDHSTVDTIELKNIEQVNHVAIVSKHLAESLNKLPKYKEKQ